MIAFGLWYWDRDRGGAAAHAHHPLREPGVRLPGDAVHRLRATDLGAAVRRLPVAGLWTATAFSPTDVSAIKRSAKLLMMTEAAVSVGIGALVIARAIKILK